MENGYKEYGNMNNPILGNFDKIGMIKDIAERNFMIIQFE